MNTAIIPESTVNAIDSKPEPIQYNFEAIPETFKEFNNWLLWKYINKNGKWTKIPYQPNGNKASATSPNNWCSFNECVKAFRSGKFTGIGFAIGDSGLTCIDIDHESEWDSTELDALLSGLNDKYYKEKSPSGDGYHLWIKAVKPKEMGCKSTTFYNSLVEVYNSDRYITMTGSVIEPHSEIHEAQSELENVFSPLIKNKNNKPKNTHSPINYFDDESIINKIRKSNAQGNTKFIQLHDSGFISDDHSADDMSYVNVLAFYTSCNAAQIDRIYRTSAIYRDKWDRKTGDVTYGMITIDKAIQGCTRSYDPSYQQDVTFEFSDETINEDPFNISGVELTKPHGFLGEICKEIRAMSDRPLELSYPLTGLHIINQLAKGRLGIDGRKTNLMTLLIAPTAYGKDINLRALSELSVTFRGTLKPWLNKPRTDKDILHNMVERLGDCSYKVDEAHSLFQSIKSSTASVYTVNIAAEMLDIATTGLKDLSGNHKREFFSEEEKNYSQLCKKYEKIKNDTSKTKLIKWYELQIEESEKRIENIQNGTPDPTMHMCMFSTPENIDSVATSSSVESGLMGRCIVLRVHDKAQKLKAKEQAAFSEQLNRRFKEMNDLVGKYSDPVKFSPDAEKLSLEMKEFYENDKYRNHPTKGGLYRRMFERILSIASILGSESGTVTTDDLRYALAITLEHVENVTFLIAKNSANDSPEDMVKHLCNLIMQRVKPVGVAQSVVKNQVLNCCKEARQNDKVSLINGKLSLYDHALKSLLDNNKIHYKDGTKKLAR